MAEQVPPVVAGSIGAGYTALCAARFVSASDLRRDKYRERGFDAVPRHYTRTNRRRFRAFKLSEKFNQNATSYRTWSLGNARQAGGVNKCARRITCRLGTASIFVGWVVTTCA